MSILVACEYSGVVRDAFIERGFDAVSCDLLPTERPGPHIQGDVLEVLQEPWDLVIAHPPCQRLSQIFWTNSTTCNPSLLEEIPMAINFFKRCQHANSPLVAVENPVMHTRAKDSIGQANCVVEPWHHGHPYSKRTLLWLKGLPPLMPTQLVSKVSRWMSSVYIDKDGNRTSGPAQSKSDRARTFPGIAGAMAEQWGPLL